MSTSQTVEIYKILNRYFKNEEDATRVVSELELVIDNKFEEKKSVLATKEDLKDLRQEMNDLRVELISKLNDHFKWTIASLLSVGAFIVALIKWL